MGMHPFARLEQNAQRVREVVGTLARYGLAEGLRWLDVDWIQQHLRSAGGEVLRDQPLEARIRLVLTELGTTFVKLGQTLSTRPDLVGNRLADELASLQQSAPADPPELARQALEAELGVPLNSVFARFDDVAFAAASIAQVHRARLPDGREVAVKLMRRGVRERVQTDLDILHTLARLAERHATWLRPYQPVAIVRQLARSLRRELDFRRERRALARFRSAFAGERAVHFPRVHDTLSTRDVLTMEFLRGVSLGERERLAETGADLGALARRGAALWLDMIFRDGVYHADPHPGNLLRLDGDVLGVLDCGMVARLDPRLRDDVEAMLFAAVDGDAEDLADLVLQIGSAPAAVDRRALAMELDEFLHDHLGEPLAELDVGAALQTLFDLVRRYGISLPAPLSMLLRTLIVLDGTSRALDRTFSLAELLQPIYRRALRRRLSPQRLLRRSGRAARDWQRLAETLPKDLRRLLEAARSGAFRVQFEHHNLQHATDRLTRGLVAAAAIVGGSALWANAAPPSWCGMSLPGLALFALAAVLFVRAWLDARRDADD